MGSLSEEIVEQPRTDEPTGLLMLSLLVMARCHIRALSPA